MRRIISGMLAAFLLLLCGCHGIHPGRKDDVRFYYPRTEFQYGTAEGVISPEARDMSGHLNDPDYLMRMYLMGPLDKSLEPAFPIGTRLMSWEETPEAIRLVLSQEGEELPEIQFTLACACIAKTCMELRGVNQVSVERGSQSMTIEQSELLLLDTNNAQPNGGTQ